jgi:hypothetical protein
MAVNQKPKVAYGLSQPNFSTSPMPIVTNRIPTTADTAEVGTIWIDKTTNEAWVLTSVISNISNWLPLGITDYGVGTDGQVLIGATGGLPTFNAITAGPAINVGLAPHHTTIGLTNGTNGQVLIGGGAAPAWSSITAGANITLTPGAGTLTIASTATGFSWVPVTVDGSFVNGNGVIVDKATLLTMTLPTIAAVGTQIGIQGTVVGAGGWTIAQNALQNIQLGDISSAVGIGGSVSSTLATDGIVLICVVANTTWQLVSANGNLTVV